MMKIICGNALTELNKLPDESVNCIITDPPWNVGKDYGIFKENWTEQEYLEWIQSFIFEFKRVSNNKIVLILGSEIILKWWQFLPDAKLIIVHKGTISRGKIKNFFLQYKGILTTVPSNEKIYDIWTDIKWPGDGYFYNEPRYGHPAMTPLKLAERLVRIFSKENDIIFEPFCGVGTIPLACLKHKRKFIATELNQTYINKANERIQAYITQLRFE